ncbi:hypothetical protein FRX31_007430 [Thalictrum thalictroides]|uniref:Uncharacterized protein n=1 Tax=Thalictrum thalictroides TaxID=46969 RepID=A0A7J6X284_THATH|nr:hypothetical protein FRX31_007430 [Thalictrum thalictroides]
MNGYSKIRFVSTAKSKSVDFTDVFSPPQTPKPITNTDSSPVSQTQTQTQQPTKESKNKGVHDPISRKENEDDVGKRFGVILSRNCSTSSTASQRFKTDKQNTSLESAVMRAFSMRRSTSVSEGYCRIYDQNDPTLCSPTDDDAHLNMQRKSKKKRRGNKILRVCKSLFGM